MLYPSLIFKIKPPVRQEPIQITSAKMKALSYYLIVCHIMSLFPLKNFIQHLTYRARHLHVHPVFQGKLKKRGII